MDRTYVEQAGIVALTSAFPPVSTALPELIAPEMVVARDGFDSHPAGAISTRPVAEAPAGTDIWRAWYANRFAQVVAADGGYLVAPGTSDVLPGFDAAHANVDLMAVFETVDDTGNIGLIARLVDQDNYLRALIRPSVDQVCIQARVAGSTVPIGAAVNVVMGAGERWCVRFRVNGDQLFAAFRKLVPDATPIVITATSSQFQSATRVGVAFLGSTTIRCRDFAAAW